MDIIAVIQARMGSTRLPGKVLTDLCGKPALGHIVERAGRSRYIGRVVVATSVDSEDDAIDSYTRANSILLWRGSQTNVLKRYHECAAYYHADVIVRLTGDNTLIDSTIIDSGIRYFLEHGYDYVYYRKGLPLGMAVEIFTWDSLDYTYYHADDTECLEHVTPYIYRNSSLFRADRAACIGENHEDLRWTLDTEKDRELITEIYRTLYGVNPMFTYEDILAAYTNHPQWRSINSGVQQVEVAYQGEAFN